MATANWRGSNSWPKPYVQPRKRNEEDGKSNKEQIGKTDAIELEKCRFVEDKALKKAEQKAITLWVPSFVRTTQGLQNRQDPHDYTEHSAVTNFEIWYKKHLLDKRNCYVL